jgi:hypothetical protein
MQPDLTKDVRDGVRGMVNSITSSKGPRRASGDWRAMLVRADGSVDLDMPLAGWANHDKVAILLEKLKYARARLTAETEERDEENFKLKSLISGLCTRAKAHTHNHGGALHHKDHKEHKDHKDHGHAPHTHAHGHLTKDSHHRPTDVSAAMLTGNSEEWDLDTIALNLNINTNRSRERDLAVFKRLRNDVLYHGKLEFNDGAPLYTEEDIKVVEGKVAEITATINAICAASVGLSVGDPINVMTATPQFAPIATTAPPTVASAPIGTSATSTKAPTNANNRINPRVPTKMLAPMPMMATASAPVPATGADGGDNSNMNARFSVKEGMSGPGSASSAQGPPSFKLSYTYTPVARPPPNAEQALFTDEVDDEEDDLRYSPGYIQQLTGSYTQQQHQQQHQQQQQQLQQQLQQSIVQLRPLTASLTLSKNKSAGALVGRLRPFSSSGSRILAASTDAPTNNNTTNNNGSTFLTADNNNNVTTADGFEPALHKKMKLVNPLQQPGFNYSNMTSTSATSVGHGWGVHAPVPLHSASAQQQQLSGPSTTLLTSTGGKSFADSNVRGGWRKAEADLRRDRGLGIVRQSYEEFLNEQNSKQAALNAITPSVTNLQQSKQVSSKQQQQQQPASASVSGTTSPRRRSIGEDANMVTIPLKPRSASSSPTNISLGAKTPGLGAANKADASKVGANNVGIGNSTLQQRTVTMLDQLNNCSDIIQSRILFGIRPVPEIIAREQQLQQQHAMLDASLSSQQPPPEGPGASVDHNHALLMAVANGVGTGAGTGTGNADSAAGAGVSCYEELYEIAAKQHRLRSVTAVSHRQRENEIVTFAQHLNDKINTHIRAVQQLEAQLMQLGNSYYDNRAETCTKASKHYDLKA